MKKGKKLLSILLSLTLLASTLSVSFVSFAAGDAGAVKQAIESYKGYGYVYDKDAKKNVGDAAFQAIADRYKELSDSEKEELGIGNMLKVAAFANGYFTTGNMIVYPTDIAKDYSAKDQFLSGKIDEMIGYTQVQKDAIDFMRFVASNPETFVPKGQTLPVKLNTMKFTVSKSVSEAQVAANIAGIKELTDRYAKLSDSVRQYVDLVNFSGYGHVITGNALGSGYTAAGSLFKTLVAYELTKTAPFTGEFTEKEPAEPLPEEIQKTQDEINLLKEELGEDYQNKKLKNHPSYRKLAKLMSKMDEYSTSGRDAFMKGPQFEKYLEDMAAYKQKKAAFANEKATALYAGAYANALAEMKFPQEYLDTLSLDDELVAAVKTYENDASVENLKKVSAALQEYDTIPGAEKGLLAALDRAGVAPEYSKMALDYDYNTSAEITARLTGPYLSNCLYGLNESFFAAISQIRDTPLPVTREKAMELYMAYVQLSPSAAGFMPFDVSVKEKIIESFVLPRSNYPQQGTEQPEEELNAYKKLAVDHSNLGVSKERMEETTEALNDTVLGLLSSMGMTKQDIYALIFTNKNLTQVVSALMPMLEDMAPSLGIGASIILTNINPQNLAKDLSETAYADAAEKLSAMGSSWKAAAGTPAMEAYLNASHGFQDGDANGFVQALASYLRSFYELLEGGAVNMHLQNYADEQGNIQPGLYEKVLVPLYEMLGIPDYLSSRDYSSRILGEKQITGTLAGGTVYLDGQIESVLLSAVEPILAFLDELLSMPVDELLDLLPNLFYHLNNGDIANTLSYAVNHLGALGGIVDETVKETIKNLNTDTLYDLLNDLLIQGIDLSGLLGDDSLLQLNLSKAGWDKFVDNVIHCGTPEAVASLSMDQAWRFHIKADRADITNVTLNFVFDELRVNSKAWKESGAPLNTVQSLISGLTSLGNKFIANIALPAILPDADYSGVRDAIAAIPKDLSNYTEESVKKVTQAKEAVVFGLSAKHQEEVDAMATRLNGAVNALEKKPAKPEDPTKPVEPTTPGETSKPGGTDPENPSGGTPDVPKTGDRLFAAAGTAAVGAVLGILLLRRKKKQ